MNTDERIAIINTTAIEPWERLNHTLVQQKALEANRSDEGREAGRLATEIRRLAGVFDLDSREMSRRSGDWSLISEVAEGSKDRLLSSAARRTALTVSSHFEADGKGSYRFINNRVMIVPPRTAKVEFLSTAARAIEFLINELELEAEWQPKVLESTAGFSSAVVLDAGPDPNRVNELLEVQFYKKDETGELATFNPQNWQLELRATEKPLPDA